MRELVYEGQRHEIRLRYVEETFSGEVLSGYFIHVSPQMKRLSDMFGDRKHYTKMYQTEKRALQVYDHLRAFAADTPYEVDRYVKRLRFSKS